MFKRLLFGLLLVGCAATPPAYRPYHPACTASSVGVLHASPSFAADERYEVLEGVKLLRALSSGRIDYTPVFDLESDGDSPFRLHRMLWWDEETRRELESLRRQRNNPDFEMIGWQHGSDAYVLADLVAKKTLRFLVAHELGHLAGLRWPGCIATDGDCYHSPDAHALMAARFSASGPNESDRELCRASCLCP